jgi:hypothetical protein
MDAEQFDTLARSLTDRRSRRGTLAAVVGGVLGVAGLAETDAKKKPCPPGKTRKQGKCKNEKVCSTCSQPGWVCAYHAPAARVECCLPTRYGSWIDPWNASSCCSGVVRYFGESAMGRPVYECG